MNFSDIHPGMKIRATAEDKTCTCYRPGDEFMVHGGSGGDPSIFCRVTVTSPLAAMHTLSEDEAPLFEPVTQ